MIRTVLLAATVLAAGMGAASAQPVSGLYIGAGAGANFMHDEPRPNVGYPQQGVFFVPSSNSPRLKLDTGFAGVASVGYGFGNGLRVEVEGSYRQNKLTQLSNHPSSIGGSDRAGGDEMKYGAMVNVLYELPISFVVQPYVGVGIGYQWAQFRNGRINGRHVPIAQARTGYDFLFRTNDVEGSFAAQAILGASFPISAVPGLALTAEYRFMALTSDRTYDFQYFAPNTSTRAAVRFSDNFNHSVMLGVRYAFNQAPAPVQVVNPPVTPPPEAARTYLVFFDWDRADLTDRARQIINEAAQATTRVAVTRIEVAGHTDKSGTPRYNQGLSQRRAQNVAAELVRLGVPRAAITTQAFGESRPLVQTADGVREPQNRRVEIVLR